MFPLGSVLVPSGVLPLHVFEPRYRRMMGDCLEGAGRFGVVLIERGSEVGGGDQRCDVGTIATIVDSTVTPDGRWGVLAVGTERLRVIRWRDDDPYPQADIEPWPDDPPDPGATGGTPAAFADHVGAVTTRLRRVLSLATELGVDGLPTDVSVADDPTEAIWELVAMSPLGPADRQRLLAAPDAWSRLRLLDGLLDETLDDLYLHLAAAGEPGNPDGVEPNDP